MARGKKKTNEEFQQELREKSPGVHTDEKYINASTKISFYCDYGHHWMSTPTNILNMHSHCPYCAGQKAIVGETDLWTTRPDIAQLLVDPEDGYLYSQFSHKKIKFLCPICKNQFLQDLNHVSQRGLSCPNCSDNISFPNKFMREILLSLNVDFEPEYSPIWIKPKRYDFYFEHNNKKYIIEMDGGLGHGNDPPNGTFWFDKDLSKSLDEYKDKLAKQHGIDVIRIDCNYNADVAAKNIFNNIVNSKISDIFDISKIDIKTCELNAQKTIFKDICDLFNDGKSPKDISSELHLSAGYVRNMIRKARRLGIITRPNDCVKNPSLFIAKDDPIICVETNEKFIGPNEVLKKLGFKIYDVIDKPNRSSGKTNDGRKRHWVRMNDKDAQMFIQEYYANK